MVCPLQAPSRPGGIVIMGETLYALNTGAYHLGHHLIPLLPSAAAQVPWVRPDGNAIRLLYMANDLVWWGELWEGKLQIIDKQLFKEAKKLFSAVDSLLWEDNYKLKDGEQVLQTAENV